MGVSILSLVEIIYHFSCRNAYNLRDNTNKIEKPKMNIISPENENHQTSIPMTKIENSNNS